MEVESEGPGEIGAIRMSADGQVEHFDGTDWRPYGELPDDGDLSVARFRGDDPDGPARP